MSAKKLCAGAGSAELKFPKEYFPTHEHYDRILDPLHCKALLVEGEGSICIISMELPSLKPYTLIDEMKELVHDLTGYETENIWIGMTHNMAAPHVPPAEAKDGKFEIHVRVVREAITEAVEKAKKHLTQALVGTGCGEAYINVNRDFETREGWWLGVEGTGPSDKAVTVLRFDDLEGNPLAVLFTYACKSSVLEDSFDPNGMRRVTSEVSGRACQYVEKRLHAPVLYFMADGGDQVPRKKANYYSKDQDGHIIEVNHYDEGAGWMEEQAVKLGKSVLETVQTIVCGEMGFMSVDQVDLTYPGQKSFPKGLLKDGPRRTYEYLPDDPQTVQFDLFCINDLAIIGSKPEITSITGMELRRLSPFTHTTIATMINGGFNYMADASVYDRFLFEGTHSMFWKGAAERFVQDMTGILTKIRKGDAG
ncbi:MAG: hypothetical protein LUH19_07295 [Lachnospiraceae bacterium]|nr:hypothetical protein [Lachnospiraceae bacterium]